MTGPYHEGNRRLQEQFDTTRLADRIEERLVRETIDDDDRVFIESRGHVLPRHRRRGRPPSMLVQGRRARLRAGARRRTIAFPSWDGNGMYLSAGNVLVNPHVGLLFIDFERRRRLRLNGVATIDDDDPLLAAYPEAQFVVRVRATEVFPNCPRYIHEYRLVERSRFTPREDCPTPAPSWKTRDWSRDVLPAGDPALDPGAEIL